jgi:hypothetical protein
MEPKINQSFHIMHLVKRFNSVEKDTRDMYENKIEQSYPLVALVTSIIQFAVTYTIHSLVLHTITSLIAVFVLTCSFASKKAFAIKIKSAFTRFFYEKQIQFETLKTKKEIKSELTDLQEELIAMKKANMATAEIKRIAQCATDIIINKVA